MVAYTPTNTRRSASLYVAPTLASVLHRAGAMATWIKANQVSFTFLATLILGVALITAAAFTVSVGLGLLTAGVLSIASGHWVTYLKTTGAAT